MAFFDFDEIKRSVSLSSAAQMLGLQLKQNGAQMRGPCPACAKGGDRALVITEGKGWFCFAAHSGGDVIALTAHIKNVPVKDAAAILAKATQTVPATVPQETAEGKTLAELPYLEHDHAAVIAIGFDPDLAKALGIGYAPKGLMRGTVAIPIRDADGTLQGYVGVEDARLPPNFMTNIVPFGKKSA